MRKPTGNATLTYDGRGLDKGGTGVLSINGKKVGEGRIHKTQGAAWSLAGETADIGKDAYSPVTDDYDLGRRIHRHNQHGEDSAQNLTTL